MGGFFEVVVWRGDVYVGRFMCEGYTRREMVQLARERFGLKNVRGVTVSMYAVAA